MSEVETSDYRWLAPGDPAPWFRQRSMKNPSYVFDTAAGRYVLLCFFGSLDDDVSRAAVDACLARGDLFDDVHASFFGVSSEPADEERLREISPGRRFFLDFDHRVAGLYGAAPIKPQTGFELRRTWVLLGPDLRVIRVFPFAMPGSGPTEVLAFLQGLPPPGQHLGVDVQAPVLYLPNVLDPELCQKLIGLYEADGGEVSGFMRDVDGKTVLIDDPSHKVRRDYMLADDEPLKGAIQVAMRRRIVTELRRLFFFEASRMERYVVACYTAEDGGHFRAHRDNTTKGTAHRRFAVSINLNAEFEGGELSFPEYGKRGYKPPPGGAVVFSCAMLHQVSKVTAGRRYAFLPFLYDEAAAQLRERNAGALDGALSRYRAGPQSAEA